MNIREALMRAEKSLKLSKRKDWYKILGISKTASMSEIKKAYKKLALQWHPDKNVDNREEAEAKFREIAAAYEILGDEDKRTKYDRGEDIKVMGGMGGGGFNPFGGGQQFTFHFEGGFPGGGQGFPGGGRGFPGGYGESAVTCLFLSLSVAHERMNNGSQSAANSTSYHQENAAKPASY